MNSLSFNPATGAFIFRSRDAEGAALARSIGLDRSVPASSPGEDVYFTRDEYAALPLWKMADNSARDVLLPRHIEYAASMETEWRGGSLLCPGDRDYMPFQKAGIRYALDRPHALIGDEPGLGKTVMAIGVANEMKARRVLVICPASVRLQWRREVRAWSIFPRPIVYPVLKASDGINPHAHYTIISYDLARHAVLHAAMRKMHFDLLVLDEAHYLKTWDALRTRAVFGDGEAHDERFLLGLAGCAERILGLTGTPLPNRPRECYTLARHLCWDSIDWMSEDKFRWRYNPSGTMPSGYVKEMVGRLPELRSRLRCNFMVRRHKKDVLKDLPDKRYELAYVEENGQIREALRAEKMLDIDPLDLKGLDAEILGQISTVRRMMGLAKVDRVGEHVAMLLDGGVEKLVVFAHHREVITLLQERLARYGCVAVNGAVSPVARAKAVLAFQSDPKCRVFIGQLQAAGTGLDGLQQVCGHVVFAEADWVPGTNEQCVDRLHRHGQKGAVLAQFLVAPGSLDEKVLGSAIAKAHTVFDALDNR